MTDRLFADRKYVDLFRKKLKDKKVLGFSGDVGTEIYMFAFALGVNAGYMTPSKQKEGLVQDSAVRGVEFAMSFIYSVALQELLKDGRECEITDKDVVYGIAEGYANTGLAIIEEMIPDFNKYDEETMVNILIEKLDDKIKELNF